MALPKNVQKQGDRSDELMRQLRTPDTDPNEDAPKPETDDGRPAKTQTGEQPTDRAKERDAVQEGADTWKNRYKALEGKYRAEVPRLHKSLRDVQSENDDLKARVNDMERRSETRQSNPSDEGVADSSVDTSMYDEDLLAVIRHEARQMVERETGQRLADIDRMKQREDQRDEDARTERAKAEFVDAMDDLVPDWKDVDNDPEFHAYLAETNERTGNPRQDDLIDAVSNFDTVGSARIFNGFLRERKRDRQDDQARVPEHLQVPAASGAAPVTNEDDAKATYTRDQVRDIYQNIAKGRYSRQRAKEMEADIEKAYRDGRIRA